MKIAHIITRFLRAGAEENTLATCRYQLEQGHDVYLVHGNDFDEQYCSELPPQVTRIVVPDMVHPIHPIADIKAVRALRALYRENSFDIVHTHQSKAGIVGRLATSRTSSTAVHTVHIAPFLNVGIFRERVFVALERYCARHSAAIISVSSGMRDAYLEKRIGTSEQHHVIHSGMHIARFKEATAPDDWRTVIHDWPHAQRPFLILMVAAFEPRKRQELFLHAAAQMLKRRPDICIAFCGQGARLDAARELAATLGIAAQVRFLGYLKEPEVAVALADLCVLTSEREGLPRVLIQYVAAGKAVVAHHLPGIEEILTDGQNAVVVQSDDMAAVVSAVEQLSESPDRLRGMATASKGKDVSGWDVKSMGQKIQAVYDDCLKNG